MEVPHWDGSRASRGIGGLWDNCLQKLVVLCILSYMMYRSNLKESKTVVVNLAL